MLITIESAVSPCPEQPAKRPNPISNVYPRLHAELQRGCDDSHISNYFH